MITEKTRNILIESAWFDPAVDPQEFAAPRACTPTPRIASSAARTSRRDFSGLRPRGGTASSNPAGGRLDGRAIDAVARQLDLAPVALHLSEVHRILGEKFETNEIFRILQQLGFELMPERGGDPDFTVHIPSWRLDVEREIDLIEEIARLHGYDKFANTLPAYAGAVVEAARCGERSQAADVAAGARLQRSGVADLHLARGCGDLFRRAPWLSWPILRAKKRRSCAARWCRAC